MSVALMTADQLNAEGKCLIGRGHIVVFLYNFQEWMAVELQAPFLRYEKMPMTSGAN